MVGRMASGIAHRHKNRKRESVDTIVYAESETVKWEAEKFEEKEIHVRCDEVLNGFVICDKQVDITALK